MSEREKILDRIREALRKPAPHPHSEEGNSPGRAPGSKIESLPRAWLPLVGEDVKDQMEVFAKNAADLKARFQLVDGIEGLRSQLLQLRDTEDWKAVGSHHGLLTDAACATLDRPVLHVDSGYQPETLEKCAVGITECDALVAQTGSVLLTSRSAGGRALSVLPPHHVVIARLGQMVRDLPEAFALLKRKYEKNYPSFISFVTGPSRTGDIERILVLGAHGPKKLTIFCLRN